MYLNVMHFRSQTTFTMSMYTQILKLEPDLDPKPEQLCEHGAWYLTINRYSLRGKLFTNLLEYAQS